MQLRKSKSEKRRSIRVQLKVQLTVSGVDSSGFRFEFTAETVLVSKYGARLRTKELPQSLCCGTGIRVILPRGRESRMGRVVWLKGTECGVELQDAGKFWGVTFPPYNGEESAPEEKLRKSLPGPQEPARTPSVSQLSPVKAFPLPSTPVVDIPAEGDGPMVLLTGISANCSYFQEQTTLRIVDEYEASVVIRQAVIIGASLRVLVSGRTVRASVLDVQRHAQPKRCFVRLRFAEPMNQESWASPSELPNG